jgi:hypothetical protein
VKKAAVVIGVDQPGDLPPLESAARSAKHVAKWLKSQDYITTCFDDADGKAVTLKKIKSKVFKLVKLGTLEELVIYFSGHGFLKDGSEQWMLSGAPNDTNEAINLKGSELLARDCGIPHVTFISDACRSTPDTLRASKVNGGELFPNENPSVDVEIDRFLAALPGDPAYELKLDDSTSQYESIFTACFLQAFEQPEADMVREVDKDGTRIRVVPSRRLKPYLARNVDAAAQKKSINLSQKPQSIIESGDDYFLSEILRKPMPAAVRKLKKLLVPERSKATEVEGMQEISEKMLFSVARNAFVKPSANLAKSKPLAAAFEKSVKAALGTANARDRFETRTGVIVQGIKLTSAHCNGMKVELTGEPGVVRLHPFRQKGQSCSVLLCFGDGSGTVVAALSDYIANVIVEKGKVIAVNYVPSMNSHRGQNYHNVRKRIEPLRATVAASVRHGAFIVERGRGEALADRIRVMKEFDPTLGLYAAYAYADAGLRKDVNSVLRYMYKDLQANLFDVAMLARSWKKVSKVAPFCPMLSQGWSLVRPLKAPMHPVVAEAGTFRRESLWTTFELKGVDLLKEAISRGHLT